MTTIPDAHEDARHPLRMNLYEHLDEAEFLATKLTGWREDDIRSARLLIPDLVAVIRGMIIAHDDGLAGMCTRCESPWPCPDLVTIHRLVKTPDTEITALLRRRTETAP